MAYLNIVELESAIENLAAAYSDTSELIALPNLTHEGRQSRALRLGVNSASSVDGILLLGGMHAREWVPPDTMISLAADLLEAFDSGTGLVYGGKSFSAKEIDRVMKALNLFIYPCVNPDGRHHSQTTDAMWRKNRRAHTSGGNCIGVDLNRNFDFLWDHQTRFASDAGVRTSANPCDRQVYRGPGAASEPEVRNVVWMLDTYPKIRWHIDVHSAVPVILHAWGSDQNQNLHPTQNFQNHAFDSVRGRADDSAYGEFINNSDQSTLQQLGNRMNDAIKDVRGIDYGVEQAYGLYPTSGASDDYAFSRHFADSSKSKVFGFTVECGSSFQPSWSEAEEVIRETSAGLVAFCLEAAPASSSADSGGLVSWGPNRLDVFVVGTNSRLHHKWWNGSSWGPSVTGYENMGGQIITRPRVVAWGPNRLDVFVVGTDTGLYHKWWNGSAWGPSVTGYENMGGRIQGDPEVVSWGPNRLDVFVVGMNSGLYHKWWNGSAWGPSVTGYENMGGRIVSQPCAVSWGPNRLDVFVIGTDSGLYHKWWNGSAWGPSVTGYENMGGKIHGDPEVVSWGPNRLDVFVMGMNSGLYHKWWNGSAWGPSVTGYEFLGGRMLTTPTAVSWGPNRLDLFVVGTDSALYHKWWNGTSWGPSVTGWESLGGRVRGRPHVVAWGPNRLDVFVVGMDSGLYHKWWNGSAWGPSVTGYENMGGKVIDF